MASQQGANDAGRSNTLRAELRSIEPSLLRMNNETLHLLPMEILMIDRFNDFIYQFGKPSVAILAEHFGRSIRAGRHRSGHGNDNRQNFVWPFRRYVYSETFIEDLNGFFRNGSQAIVAGWLIWPRRPRSRGRLGQRMMPSSTTIPDDAIFFAQRFRGL
jgi:hypothetical protein